MPIIEKALEARARRAAMRVDLRAVKSRKRESFHNFGGFMLLDLDGNYVVEGSGFNLSAENVIEICKSY